MKLREGMGWIGKRQALCHRDVSDDNNCGPQRRSFQNKRLWAALCTGLFLALFGCGCGQGGSASKNVLTLRVANMEEYIDEGRWEDEVELSGDNVITSDKAMVAAFADWYEATYGQKIRVDYATVGTNEELYNLMSLGNTFDVVCPSEYMIMKLMEEKRLLPLSQEFRDASVEENYYTKGVSPYIEKTFDDLSVQGEPIGKYAAGYMWGTLGLVYNPEYVSAEDASRWAALCDKKYYRQTTMKDSVRDSLFAGICILNEKEYLKPDFLGAKDYRERLAEMQNDTTPEVLGAVEDILSDMRKNAYSVETDSGRADLISGKAYLSMQWSGDAVYAIDVAEESGVTLCYSAPRECTNLWFDGWVMMKDGIAEDPRKQQAAEAFINFISRPDNVVRNMYSIGYTSVIAGGESEDIFDYLRYCYEAEDDAEDSAVCDLSYFFGIGDRKIVTTKDQLTRQLYAQYPPEDVIGRSVVMRNFDDDAHRRVGQMWINIRCFDPWK